MASGEDN
jgi:hypothetical protein